MPIALSERARRARALHDDESNRERDEQRRPRPTVNDVPATIQQDWAAYVSCRCEDARNRLVAYYMSVHVRPIAARIHASLPSQVELDDLMQQGYLGLIDAMQRYELNRDTRFETFSRRRVFGCIQDYLRQIDPIPRLTRTRSKKLQVKVDRFRTRFGRVPDDEELRNMIDAPVAAFDRTIAELRPPVMVPFSSVRPEGDTGDDSESDAMDAFEDTRSQTRSPLDDAEKRDLQRWITRGFDHRDRLIIILYYYEQMTMREIGQTVGISESRVSQRLDSILECLRSRLTAGDNANELTPR